MTDAGSEALLERDGELEALDAAVAAAQAGRGAVVLIEGPAGVGKTALLHAARERAARGMVARLATGGELERDFPFGLVRQLLEPPVLGLGAAEREALFAGAAAHAAPVVGATPAASEHGADAPFATLHGLYWLTVTLAERAPLALLVDDAHWADQPSLRFLAFLARRVAELPVLVVLAARTGEAGSDQEPLADGAGAVVLRPAPLSEPGVETLCGDRQLASVVHGATGGNPFLVRELLRSSEGAAAADGRVPFSVVRSVERRLGRLPVAARALARTLAVLGERPRTTALLAAEAGPLAALRAADLVVEGPDGRLRYVHPVVRRAVADGVPAAERDELHAWAAGALRDDPGAQEDAVAHLLAGPPLGQPWAAALLRAGAGRALANGAPETAVRHLRRAVEEAGDDDRVQLELARAEAHAGDPAAADRLTEVAAGADPGLAAEALTLLIGLSRPDGFVDRALGLLGRLDAGHPVAQPLREQLLSVLTMDPALAGERARVRDGSRAPGVLGLLALDGAAGDGTRAEVLALVEEALAARPLAQPSGIEQPTAFWAVMAALAVDAPGPADAALHDGEATAQRHGSRLAAAHVASMRASWLLQFGSLTRAEAHAREAVALWDAIGSETMLLATRSTLAATLVLLGGLEEADRTLAEVPADAELGRRFGGGLVWTARADLRLAQGRPTEAVADLRRLEAHCAAYGWRRFPRGFGGPRLARALAGAGARDEAAARGEAEVAAAARRGVGALHAEALIALGHARDGTAALDAFTRAVAAAADSPAPLVRAQAAYELGAAQRRAGRLAEARAPLAAARDGAHRLGATELLAAATAELTAAGGRPRRIATRGVDALTPSERRVAEHAAGGLTNRQIAEALFVTRKTVEFQLGAAYGKLGIRSRRELPAALAREPASGGGRGVEAEGGGELGA